MSKLPYMEFYIDDYEAATAHLTTQEDGAYMRMLRLAWRTPGCSLPDDPDWIARKCRVGRDEFDAVYKPILKEFFTLRRGRWQQKKQRAIWSSKNKTISARKQAGRKGGIARALKYKEKTSSKGKDLLKQKSGKPLASRTRTIKSNTLPIGSAPEGASDEELKLYIFNVQLPWLASKAGLKEQRARALFGKWLKDHSAREVVDAVSSAARNQAVDPVPYIVRVLTEGGGSMTEDQRMRRLRKAYPEIPPNYFPDVVQHIRGYFEHGVWTDNWNSFYGGTPDNSRKYDPEGFDPALRPLVERIKNEVRAEARSGSGDKGA